MKQTQYQAILERLRQGPATTWQLQQAARSTCVHKRVAEMTDGFGRVIVLQSLLGLMEYYGQRIIRTTETRAGKRVTVYRLVG